MRAAGAFYTMPTMLARVMVDLRVSWALEELGQPYCVHARVESEELAAEKPNRMLNAFGVARASDDGVAQVFESAAIVLYLYDEAGQGPKTAMARLALQRGCFAALNLFEPCLAELLRANLLWNDRPGSEWRRSELLTIAGARLADLNALLSQQLYLVEDEFGAADILMTTVLDLGAEQHELFDAHKAVQEYLARGHARPAYHRALSRCLPRDA